MRYNYRMLRMGGTFAILVLLGLREMCLFEKPVDPSLSIPQLAAITSRDVECEDPMRLMPLCERCIPGLIMNDGTQTCDFSLETNQIRKTLHYIAAKRGSEGTCEVYKYLSTETLRQRHRFAAKHLDGIQASRILDIGAYTNPIHTFMTTCPDTVFVLEPCGELSHNGSLPYSSKEISCSTNNHSKRVIRNVLPKSIKSFIKEQNMKQHFDAIVCIGCDTTYGPTWDEIMVLPRPFRLILEFSILAFNKDYPTTNKDGCSVIETEEFDFSECEDCGYEDAKQESKYGKKRKIIIFECMQNIQQNNNRKERIERIVDAKSQLESSCRNPQSKYLGMACLGEEHLISSLIINDTSLMALDALHPAEEEDAKLLYIVRERGKKYGGGLCSEKHSDIQNISLARTWWNTSENPSKLEKAMSYLSMAKNNSSDIFDSLCYAGSARAL